MALALLDNLTADMASLKHYTQALRNENIEMKQSIADLSTNRFELTREVKFLKEIVSQLISQQNVINTSLTSLNKETKSLRSNSSQHKSKLDFLQVRLKNMSHSQTQAQKLAASRQGCSTEPDEKKDPLDFPLSPHATEKITNKTTKDRLERMRKDLQDVFNKKREEKIETARAEKDTIMDDWPSHSDLNISQSEDRTQSTVTMNPTVDHSFNTGINQAQPCSLMEQVEMLNLPHMPKDPFMFGSMLENTPNGANFKRDNTSILDKRSLANSEVIKANVSPVANMGSALHGTGINLASSIYFDPNNRANSHFSGVSTRERLEVSPQNFVEDKKFATVKGLTDSQYSSHSLKPTEHLSSTMSTTAGITQSSMYGSETSTYYPSSQVKPEENYAQKYDIYSHTNSHSNSYRSTGAGSSSKDILGYRYSDPGPSQPGGLDNKTKKELYLQAENMLVNVLDRLEEPYRTTTTSTSSHHGTHHGHSNSYNVSSDVYRYNSSRTPLEYGQTHGSSMRPPIPEYETNANDISTTSNSGMSSRGTKKLKLFRKGIKNKEEFDSPKDSNLLHPNYGNQR